MASTYRCKVCNKLKQVRKPYELKIRKFCSKSCANKYNFNSENFAKKGWVANKGRKYPQWHRNAISIGRRRKYSHITKEWLLEYYINKRLGAVECAKLVNCSYSVIYRILREFDIPIRDKMESQMFIHRGGKSALWKGGKKSVECFICGEPTRPIYICKKNQRTFCSKECQKKFMQEFQKGEKSHFWKGGISKTKEQNKLYKQRRYGRIKKAGELSIQTIQLIYEDNIKKYGTLTCYLCLKPIPFGKDHLEHKIPLSRGGTNEYNNLAIACQHCNCKKHDKTEEEFKKVEVCHF